MKQKIVFINTTNYNFEEPKPAQDFLPEWYKKTEPYVENKKFPLKKGDSSNGTIKKCIPVFDAITSGYIITLPVDLVITKEDGIFFYEWPPNFSNCSPILFHPKRQAQEYPLAAGLGDIPKIINPWYIKTSKGYSSLFLPPMHRDNIIQILPGVVDTDVYDSAVNFVFVLKDKNFQGLIPAGTPIAQVIPIKRESWMMSIGKKSKLETSKVLNVFYSGYKNMMWTRKDYK
jgi:hypothetical protein